MAAEKHMEEVREQMHAQEHERLAVASRVVQSYWKGMIMRDEFVKMKKAAKKAGKKGKKGK